jgi:hypothetical protein
VEPGRPFGIYSGLPTAAPDGERRSNNEHEMIRHIRNEPAAFSPDLIRILIGALDEAWESANAEQLSIPLEDHEIAVRDLLARHIIDMAKKGERDRARLVENALYRLKL